MHPRWGTALIVILFWIPGAGADGPPQSPGLEHALLSSFTPGEPLRFTAIARGEVDWMTLYFRTAGLAAFQARPMEKTGDGAFAFILDTSTLAGPVLEYYIEAEKGGRAVSVPSAGKSGPATVQASGGEDIPEIPADLPSPEDEEARFKLPIHVNGSLQSQMSPNPSTEDIVNPNGNGNFQVLVEAQPASGWGLGIDSNFSLTNVAPPEEPAVNLTSLNVALAARNHALRVGDLNIMESEYSAAGLARRGAEYVFDNRTIYLHAFNVGTQQVRGFRGFGFPPSGVQLLGAAAGFRLFSEALSFRAVYVGGKDDPSRAFNAYASPYYQSRQGRVFALLQETRLFKSRLSLKAEFARGSYDGDLADEAGEAEDSAWNVGGTLSLGGLSLGAVYRHVGRDFNSIGLSYLANDRRGLETNLMLSLGKVSLQGQYAFQFDNVRNDVARPTTEAISGLAGLNAALSPKASFGLGYRMNNQETLFDGGVVAGQDTRTKEINGSLNLMISDTSSLTVAVTNSDLTSLTFPTTDAAGLTISLGGSFRAGDRLMLAPTLGLSRTKNRSSGEENTTLNAFVMTEAFLIPDILSLAAAGSFNRMEMAALSVSNALDLTGGLNFYLGKLLGAGNILVTLKGQHRSNAMSGLTVHETRALAQADIAF